MRQVVRLAPLVLEVEKATVIGGEGTGRRETALFPAILGEQRDVQQQPLLVAALASPRVRLGEECQVVTAGRLADGDRPALVSVFLHEPEGHLMVPNQGRYLLARLE